MSDIRLHVRLREEALGTTLVWAFSRAYREGKEWQLGVGERMMLDGHCWRVVAAEAEGGSCRREVGLAAMVEVGMIVGPDN